MARFRTLCLAVWLAGALTAVPAAAQDFRGSINGVVTDTLGAALPDAIVTATNRATNAVMTSTTSSNGVYNLLYLTPGLYTISTELSGFTKVVRESVEVRVGDRLTLDTRLDVGQIAETVAVRADALLLERSSASVGQVIDERRISLMPLPDGNPLILARLVAGVTYTGDLRFSRPFDNGSASSINVDGATGGNEFTLDGSPNMASGRRVAFVPPAGAVREFKVLTASFDAADGHTAGATVNVALKSGTNALRGEAYYYVRDDTLSATDFFVNRSGATKPELGYERFGGSTGGPVRVPGYAGRDRTFFFGAVEWLFDEFPEPEARTVPTQAMRNGDFSALLGQNITIYDPATARRDGTGVLRTPFPNNIIPPDRINPVARELLRYYPAPNQPGDAQGRNNYFSVNPRTDDFYSILTRVDHRLTDEQQVFVRYARNNRREARGNWTGEIHGIRPIGGFLYRINDSLTYDHLYSVSGSSLFNLRTGWSRFHEPTAAQHEGEFDLDTLGFSSTTLGQFQQARYLPRFDFDSLSDIGDNLGATTTHSIYSLQPTWTRFFGVHSLRVGYDLRLYRERGSEPGRAAGLYEFRSNYTRLRDNSAGLFGQDVAAFLLGLPAGGSIDRNSERLNTTWHHGVFLQDDWKPSSRLTINLGIRYEYESATTESLNRNVRGFDPEAMIGIAAAARTTYAANPIPELAAAAFSPRGGLRFPTDDRRGFFDPDGNNIQPRIGFAYSIGSRTVVRGGLGVYTVPNVIFGTFQPGFSASTPIVTTLDNGLTFRANLVDPFPDGVSQPAGAALGANTFLGRELSRFVPVDFDNAQNLRYTIGIQRELPGQWLVEASYAGSRGWDLTTGGGGQNGEIELNAVPAAYLSTSLVRDQATIDVLTAQVANPFRGLLPGTSFNGATIERQQLLRPFPHFDNLRTRADDGSSTYNSARLTIQRRFASGYTVLAAYTGSKATQKISRLNPTDADYEERLAEFDVPHRFAVSGIWEIPFGRDRRSTDGRGVADSLIGGWSIQAIGHMQSGRPLSLQDRNLYFNGDPASLKTDYSGDTNQPAFDISGFYFHDLATPAAQRADPRIRLANNIRYFPSRVPGLRSQGLHLWDISFVKQLQMTRRFHGQFHVELLNAFNRPVFNTPNTDPTNAEFGKVSSQNNLPRDVQLALKIVF